MEIDRKIEEGILEVCHIPSLFIWKTHLHSTVIVRKCGQTLGRVKVKTDIEPW